MDVHQYNSNESYVQVTGSQINDTAMIALQINLNKRHTCSPLLMKELNTALHNGNYNSFIVFGQEPPTNPKSNRVTGFDSSHSLIYDRTCAENPRAMLYILNNINVWPMADFTSRDMATARIKTTEAEFIIVSLYMDITVDVDVCLGSLTKLIRNARRQRLEVIIGTDCNAHSTLWGSPDTNVRGECLEEFLFDMNLVVTNVGNIPTYENAVAATIIDLTLSTSDLADRISSWRVDRQFQGSDHHLIRFDLNL